MVFFRRWFLIVSTLVLGGGQVLAAAREDRVYAAAVAAFNDKFYDRAEAGLTQFLQRYGKSTNAPMAVLLLAQSEFYLGKFSLAANRLADPANLAMARNAALADRFVYWQAEAQFAAGDFSSAAQTFVSVANNFPKSSLAVTASVEAAAAYEKLNRWSQLDELLENTNGVFQRAAQLDPASETVANGRLLQSESKSAQQDFAGAIRVLNLLNLATLTPEQDWKRAHQLYRANLQLNDLDAALSAATNLLGIARAGRGEVWPTNFAESVACHAGVLEQLGRITNAIAAWHDDLTSYVPADQQQRAILKIAELSVAQKDLGEAEAHLENFLAQFPDSSAAGIARLTLGELYLKDFVADQNATNHLALAQTNFDLLLARNSAGPLAGSAFLDRGWCCWLAAQYPESLTNFQSAAQLLPMSEDLAVAKFKIGDAQFAQTNFSEALANYRAVLTDFAGQTNAIRLLGDHARYQILRARLAMRDPATLDGSMNELIAKFLTNAPPDRRQLLEQFFQSTPADSSLLLADFGSPARMRAVLRDFESQRADSALLPQVAFAVGRTFEREQNWPEAAKQYQDWLTKYPTNDLRPQVEFARNWATAQSGDETGALELFNRFVATSTNALTPLALWWMGDHFYRLGDTNYARAELYYQTIFQVYPTNELAYRAEFMAGCAAMGRQSYAEANRTYFTDLVNATNCPEELRVKAKFGYCEALRQMGASDNGNTNLQTATNILAQICPLAATNIAGALAWSETGDCDFQLGAFEAATNAYAQALNSPAADAELRSRARVGLGIVLEKMAEELPPEGRKILLDLALDNYWQAFHPEEEIKDEFWKKKAGLQILSLIARTDSVKGDKLNGFIADLKATFPQLQDSTQLKRLQQKN